MGCILQHRRSILDGLSNTAVPKYYGQFRDAVIRGEIPICKKIELEMNRIDELIEDPNIYYDEGAIDGWILFCENEMTLTDGSPVRLLDTFKLWAEQIFGWYYFEERTVYLPNREGGGGHFVRKRIKRRLINKQFLIIPRSNSKTLYETFLQSYFLVIDTTTTHQITTAPTIRQGEEVLTAFRTAITRAQGPLFKMLTEGSLQNTTGNRAYRPKLSPVKDGIKYFVTDSDLVVKPMSIDKLQGLRCKYATVDEWLSCDIREDPIGAIEQSAAKIMDYFIGAVSSEGTIRNGPGDNIKIELDKILHGEYKNPHVSIWWYMLDDISEVAMPEMWPKANPNIGITVEYDTIQRDVERAEHNPSFRNEMLAKRFNLPMEGYTYYFPYEETLPHIKRQYWNMSCAMGADLSRGDDFCAFTFLFPLPDGKFGVKTRCYITELTYRKLPEVLSNKYMDFINEGSLMVMQGSILDMTQVYDDLEIFIDQNRYNVIAFGYDPYNAKDFVERWITENGPYGVEKVPQGMKTETVPLGELKKLSEERALLFDEEIMSFCMGNCITLNDNNGNRKLYKKRADQKIDSVAAMLDAFVAYKHMKDDF